VVPLRGEQDLVGDAVAGARDPWVDLLELDLHAADVPPALDRVEKPQVSLLSWVLARLDPDADLHGVDTVPPGAP
jgi:hypothetical protein